MTYATNPTGLAGNPATSDPIWKSVLNAILVLAVGIAISFISNRSAGNAATDTSYDAVENARAGAVLSGVAVDSAAIQKAAAAKGRAMSGVAADTSYDAVENLRALAGVTVDAAAIEKAAAAKGRAISGVAANTSSMWRCGNGLSCGA